MFSLSITFSFNKSACVTRARQRAAAALADGHSALRQRRAQRMPRTVGLLHIPIIQKQWGCPWAAAAADGFWIRKKLSVQPDSSKASCTLCAVTPEQPPNEFSIPAARNRVVHVPRFCFSFLIWVQGYSISASKFRQRKL